MYFIAVARVGHDIGAIGCGRSARRFVLELPGFADGVRFGQVGETFAKFELAPDVFIERNNVG